MKTDFLEFEDVDTEYIPTQQEEEESYHFAQVQEAKTIFNHHLSKNDIPVIINTMVESVLETGDVLATAEKVKIMEMIIEGFKADKRYRDYAMEQVKLHGKGGYTSPTGAKIEIMNAGGRYGYDCCNDPKVLELEKQLKERQEFLKKLPSAGIDELDPVTGEVTHLWPASKPVSTETYKVSIKN